MIAEPILAALVAPGSTASTGRRPEPASDAGAAFPAVLAGLRAGGVPPRSNGPLPRSGIGATPGRVVEGTSPVAGPIVAGPTVAVTTEPGWRGAKLPSTPQGAGVEGTAVLPTVARDGGAASAAIERR